jgi:hypothetical protein
MPSEKGPGASTDVTGVSVVTPLCPLCAAAAAHPEVSPTAKKIKLFMRTASVEDRA